MVGAYVQVMALADFKIRQNLGATEQHQSTTFLTEFAADIRREMLHGLL